MEKLSKEQITELGLVEYISPFVGPVLASPEMINVDTDTGDSFYYPLYDINESRQVITNPYVNSYYTTFDQIKRYINVIKELRSLSLENKITE